MTIGVDFGLLDTGFKPMRMADLLPVYRSLVEAVAGANADHSNDGPFGQFEGALAEREALLWELFEQVYQAGLAKGAAGVSLDKVYALINIKRLREKATVVTETITGVAGTVIPTGSLLATADTGTLFASTADFTIPLSGSGSLDFTCTTIGAIPCLANTLTVIRTPVTGWTSATNPLDAKADQIGRLRETDAEMDVRRRGAAASIASTSLGGVMKAILEVSDVTEVKVVQNKSNFADIDGRPPFGCEVVVRGGDDDDLRAALFKVAPLGTPLTGSVPGTVLDARGDAQSIPFSRPTEVAIWIDVRLRVGDGFPSNGLALVRAQILAYGDTLKMGQAVGPFAIDQAVTVPGILEFDLHIARHDNPDSTFTLSMKSTELAEFDSTRTTITRVN